MIFCLGENLAYAMNMKYIYDVLTLATIAGGLVVMKSNAPPLTPIPSLSIRNKGKFEFGSDIVSFRANFRI